MSKITVPIEGSSVVNEGQPAGEQPAAREGWKNGVFQPDGRDRHERLRHERTYSGLGQTIARNAEPAQMTPQWGENGDGSARLSWKTEPRPEPKSEPAMPQASGEAAGLQQTVSVLENVVSMLMQNQFGNGGGNAEYGAGVEGRRNEAPNPLDFDLWSDEGMAEYQKANAEFMNAVTDERAKAQLDPYRGALYEAQLNAEYNALLREHGHEKNFAHTARAALREMAEGSGETLTEAFKRMNDEKSAKPGQRSGHLPEALSGRRNGKAPRLPRLGEIILHNQMTGRSAPVQKRRGR